MCGIFVSNIKNLKFEELHELLQHRGPDGYGLQTVDDILFYHTRLSIIDTSACAKQPMQSKCGRYILCFNGEIYNYQELRDKYLKNYEVISSGDTEVLLNLLINKGQEIIPNLEGMFAFVFYDTAKKTIIGARDRFGTKPLFYHLKEKDFCFSSSFLAVAKEIGSCESFNPIEVSRFLRSGSMVGHNTLIDGIYTVKPGEIVKINTDEKWQKYKYYNRYEIFSSDTHDLNQSANFVERQMCSSFASDVEVGCLLSGGIDSALIANVLSERGKIRIKTFNVRFNFKKRSIDSDIARKIASELNTDHYEYEVNDKNLRDEITEYLTSKTIPSLDGFNTYVACKLASKHVKVVCSGAGADELFMGYPHHVLAVLGKNCSKKKLSIRTKIKALLLNTLSKKGKEIDEPEKVIFNHRQLPSQMKVYADGNLDYRQRAILAEADNYLANTLLLDSDHSSMLNSVELRPCFLTSGIFNLAMSIPVEESISVKMNKPFMRRYLKPLIPTVALQNKTKYGFDTPIRQMVNCIYSLNIYRYILLKRKNLGLSASEIILSYLKCLLGLAGNSEWLLINLYFFHLRLAE